MQLLWGGCVLSSINTFGIPLHVLKEIETVLKVTLSGHEVWWALKKSLELFKNPTWNNWPEKVITYGRNYFLCDIWTELALDWHCLFWCQAAWSHSAETELPDLPSLLLSVFFQISAAPMCPFVYTHAVFSTSNQESALVFALVGLILSPSAPCSFCLYQVWWVMGLYLVVEFWRTVNSWYELCDLS